MNWIQQDQSHLQLRDLVPNLLAQTLLACLFQKISYDPLCIKCMCERITLKRNSMNHIIEYNFATSQCGSVPLSVHATCAPNYTPRSPLRKWYKSAAVIREFLRTTVTNPGHTEWVSSMPWFSCTLGYLLSVLASTIIRARMVWNFH
jgi:hypothetical protein